jgi:hypothetical protein
MSDKKFIVAGNYAEATEWMKKDSAERAANGETPFVSDYVIVSGEHSLRGWSDPHGVLVGSWKQRKDIKEILTAMHIQSNKPNQAILKILIEMKETESSLAVTKAAKHLADEIDKEVLNQLLKNSSLHKKLPNPRTYPLLYLNGILQSEDDYQYDGNSILMTNPADENVRYELRDTGGLLSTGYLSPNSTMRLHL